MRLFDTFTRGLVELPPPPGPIRMYFCGPTVYQRIHIGNARPFIISLWLKRSSMTRQRLFGRCLSASLKGAAKSRICAG